MTVPGVSGGTMAMVVGIYEQLLHAINNLRKHPKEYLLFLIQFILGAGIGFVLFARVVSMLLENPVLGVPTRFLFCGVVAGGIPFIWKKAQAVDKTSGNQVSRISNIGIIVRGFWIIVGIIIVRFLSLIPQGTFAGGIEGSSYWLQFVGGIVVAVALVLPGISVSHMLYILGIYEVVMKQVYSLEWIDLLPLVVGTVAGILLTTHLLEWLMQRCTREVYLVILGFVVGSLWELVPKHAIHSPVLCMVIAIGGFVIMYALIQKGVND